MSLLGSLFAPQTVKMNSLVDVVVETSKLVSNPSNVDPLLDPVRAITASLSSTGQLSAQDTATLVRVYLQLEQFLATKEPLRAFTKDELRDRIPAALRAQIETYESRSAGAQKLPLNPVGLPNQGAL